MTTETNRYMNADGTTNWDLIEKEECHDLLVFVRNGIEATIQVESGTYSLRSKRLDTLALKTDAITKEKAQQIAKVARADKSFEIKFDGGLL